MIAATAPVGRVQLLTFAVALLVALASLGPSSAASADSPGPVSGVITGKGQPLANVWVTLTPVTATGQASGPPAVAITDSSGRYDFPLVASPSVKVHVMSPLSGDFVTTYWPGVYSFAEAGIIRTSDRGAADIDLPLGGSVTGQLVDGRTGAPIAGARIAASAADDPSAAPVAIDVTTDTGAYAISGLPPVPIDLAVGPPPGRPYVTAAGATVDALRIDGGSATVDKVIRLQLGAEIRGRVLDDAGEPVARASVRAVGCSPTCPPEAISDRNGAYRLLGVAPGAGVRVEAVAGQGLLSRWFLGADPAAAPATAVDVDAGDLIDGVDIVLVRAAHLTVDVAGASSTEPLRVIVWLRTAGRTYGQYFAHRPDEDPVIPGEPIRLRVGPVPPGDYAVSISPGTANPGHLPSRWSTSSSDTPTGEPVQVSAGQDAQVVLRLDSQGSTPDPGPADHSEGTIGTWPGLAQGFLTPLEARTLFG